MAILRTSFPGEYIFNDIVCNFIPMAEFKPFAVGLGAND